MTTDNNHFKIINTRIHGVIDYAMGVFWMVMPWLLGFSDNDAATGVSVLAGGVSILYSLITDYETGLFEIISMKKHLVIDRVVGFLLILSPWIFGFANRVWVPHLITGLLAVTVSLITTSRPSAWARLRRLLHRKIVRLRAAAATR